MVVVLLILLVGVKDNVGFGLDGVVVDEFSVLLLLLLLRLNLGGVEVIPEFKERDLSLF